MIKFQEHVPSVYPSASRDFQYLCWLMNIVLNSVKHNVNDIYDLPNSKADFRLTELLAMTLGFKVKRNYDQKQLNALVAALPRILKYKGTKTAIDMAGNALMAASGAVGSFISEADDGELTVTLPKNLIDISLFTDLLPYILPAGMTCHIVRKNQGQEYQKTELAYQDAILAEWVPDLAWDDNKQAAIGLADMFSTGLSNSETANFISMTDGSRPANGTLHEGNSVLNAGLLDNNVIPMLTETLIDPYSQKLVEYRSLQGRWSFNDVLNEPTGAIKESIAFSSADFNGDELELAYSIELECYRLYFTKKEPMPYTRCVVYNYNSQTWEQDDYRIIDFGQYGQQVSAEFYDWFIANATRMPNEDPPSGGSTPDDGDSPSGGSTPDGGDDLDSDTTYETFENDAGGLTYNISSTNYSVDDGIYTIGGVSYESK